VRSGCAVGGKPPLRAGRLGRALGTLGRDHRAGQARPGGSLGSRSLACGGTV